MTEPTGSRSVEQEVLVTCARAQLDGPLQAHLRELAGHSLDWGALVSEAQRHGLTPLVYRHLQSVDAGRVPAEILTRLRESYTASAHRGLLLTRELLRLLDLCDASGIPAIAYKGPSLAAGIYGDLGLRSFIDIDILVRKSDVPRVRDLILSLGYRSQYGVTGTEEAALLLADCEYTFVLEGRLIEVHWSVAPGYLSAPLTLDTLSSEREQVSLGGRQVVTFGPEDLLLVLCVHGGKHSWTQLKLICDVAELVRARDVDWSLLLRKAGELHCRRIVLLSVLLAAELLEAPVPAEIVRQAQEDRTVLRLTRRVTRNLFLPAVEELDWRSRNEMLGVQLEAHDRTLDKMRHLVLLAGLPNSAEWREWRGAAQWSPRLSLWLSALVRPLSLARKYFASGDQNTK